MYAMQKVHSMEFFIYFLLNISNSINLCIQVKVMNNVVVRAGKKGNQIAMESCALDSLKVELKLSFFLKLQVKNSACMHAHLQNYGGQFIKTGADGI